MRINARHENRGLETQLESLRQRVTDYQDLFSVIDDELECARSIEQLYIEDIQRHEKQVKHLENLIFEVYCERSQLRERNVEKPKDDIHRSLPNFNYEGFLKTVFQAFPLLSTMMSVFYSSRTISILHQLFPKKKKHDLFSLAHVFVIFVGLALNSRR